MTKRGDETSEPGDDEIPDKIAKGVAKSPKPRAKCPTISDICEIFSDVKRLKLCSALSRKQTPAMANEPTTNSVVITWNVADEIIVSPPSIHAHTISIVPSSIRLAIHPLAMVALHR